jgi:hypothetical protein
MIDVVFHLIVLWKTHEIALLHGSKILHGCRSYAHHVVCFFSIFFSSGCVVSWNATPQFYTRRQTKNKINNQFPHNATTATTRRKTRRGKRKKKACSLPGSGVAMRAQAAMIISFKTR